MAKMELKLKKIQRSKRVRRWSLTNLEARKEQFQVALRKGIAKEIVCNETDVDDRWKKLREVIKSGAASVFGFQKARTAKKPWVSDRMLEKMDERRKWKRRNTEEGRRHYAKLNNELRRETDKAREQWWNTKCEELAEFDKRGRSDLLYHEVSRLTRTGMKSATKNVAINDKEGDLDRNKRSEREMERIY